MKLGLLFAAAVVFSWCVPAGAQAPRDLKIGDQFVYDLGITTDTHEIISLTETEIGVKSGIFGTMKVPRSISGTWSWTGGRHSIKYEEQAFGVAQSLLPLAPGKTATTSGNGHSGPYPFQFVKTCTVTDAPPMTVPAGTFEVLAIRCDIRQLGGERSVRFYNFAPALGYWASWQNTIQAKLSEFKPAP